MFAVILAMRTCKDATNKIGNQSESGPKLQTFYKSI